VPAPLARSINSGSSREPASDGDVILFVKKYICDTALAQEPLLVLKESRASHFSLVPDTKILVGFFFANCHIFLHPQSQDPLNFGMLVGVQIPPKEFTPIRIAEEREQPQARFCE
jgi:hypothetical protein